MDNEIDTVKKLFEEVRDFFPEEVDKELYPVEIIMPNGDRHITAVVMDRYSTFFVSWVTKMEPDLE